MNHHIFFSKKNGRLMANFWQKNCKKNPKSPFSPINRNNFNFSTNKSLSYFFLSNLLLVSTLPYFSKWPTYGHFWLKSHFLPINNNNFNFSTNKSSSYFFLINLLLLSKLPYFSKWLTYGRILVKITFLSYKA